MYKNDIDFLKTQVSRQIQLELLLNNLKTLPESDWALQVIISNSIDSWDDIIEKIYQIFIEIEGRIDVLELIGVILTSIPNLEKTSNGAIKNYIEEISEIISEHLINAIADIDRSLQIYSGND